MPGRSRLTLGPVGHQNFGTMNWKPSAAMFAGATLAAALFAIPAPGHAADWYRYRGPDMNGISRETGWLTKWPDEGPRQLWKAAVGAGFSSVTVSQGRLYTQGNTQDKDTINCLDAKTGAVLWQYTYSCPLDPKFYEGGTSATPTVDENRVYTISKSGDLFCLDAAKGTVLWGKKVVPDLGVKAPTWGFAGSPVVEGRLLLLNLGARGVALDKLTGAVVWKSAGSECGYSTPLPFDQAGRRVVAIMGAQALNVVDVADGAPVWDFPWKTEYDVNAAAPLFSGDEAFVSSGYDHGAALVRVQDRHATVVWQNKKMRNHFNSCVLWQGSLYGVDESQLTCLDWATGAVRWTEPKFGKGSLMMADGKLIALGEKGELFIAEATPQRFQVTARAQVLGGKCWAVPVLANGRIYCRNSKGDLVCVDVTPQP